jgi:NADPH:quinone reductase-like Zn-dependent oxidoreductase
MSLQLARELGADATVDASAEDVTEAVRELCMGSFSNRP